MEQEGASFLCFMEDCLDLEWRTQTQTTLRPRT
jgi:hypothetical protein